MRPDIAPFIPSHAVTKVESPANVFKGSLDKSIHAVPLTQIPSNWGVNTSLALNPNADGGVSSYVLKRNVCGQSDPVQQAIPRHITNSHMFRLMTGWKPRSLHRRQLNVLSGAQEFSCRRLHRKMCLASVTAPSKQRRIYWTILALVNRSLIFVRKEARLNHVHQ